MKNTAAIILAAGKGTRMNAKDKNKVTFQLGEKPMVSHTVDNLEKAGVTQIVAVVGFSSESVRNALQDRVVYATQNPPQGTGDAVKVGIQKLDNEIETVLIVYGDDSAFYPPELYLKVKQKLEETRADMVLLTLEKDDPTGLGRIVRDENGNIARIVEEKMASEEEKKIKEINTAMSCIKRDMLEECITEIKRNPASQEYYFTDIVEIALQKGKKIVPMKLENDNYWQGVNTKEDYEIAKSKYHKL